MGNYTELAFQTAREINPQATLILNDNLNETPSRPFFESDLKIINNLKEKGLVDGIGMHMHLDGSKDIDVESLIKGMQAYGVPVYITELDVDMRRVNLNDPQRLEKQAEIYRKVMHACLVSGVCKLFGTWNTGDAYSWLEDPNGGGSALLPGSSKNADPTMFFDDLSPKLAFFAVMAEMVK